MGNEHSELNQKYYQNNYNLRQDIEILRVFISTRN